MEKLRSLNKPKGTRAIDKSVSVLKVTGAASTTQTRPNDSKRGETFDLRTTMKRRLHRGLIETLNLKKGITETNNDPVKEKELRVKTQTAIAAF